MRLLFLTVLVLLAASAASAQQPEGSQSCVVPDPPEGGCCTNTHAIIIFNSGCVTASLYQHLGDDYVWAGFLYAGNSTTFNAPPGNEVCAYAPGLTFPGTCYEGPPAGLHPIPVYIFTPPPPRFVTRPPCGRAGRPACKPFKVRTRSAVMGVRG